MREHHGASGCGAAWQVQEAEKGTCVSNMIVGPDHGPPPGRAGSAMSFLEDGPLDYSSTGSDIRRPRNPG